MNLSNGSQRYNPKADEGLLNKACVYAMQKHGAQRRANGDPFFSHPLEVAGDPHGSEARRSRRSPSRCCTTPSRTPTRRGRRSTPLFGEDIGRLVEGLTKIKRLDLVSKKAAQAENFRKLLAGHLGGCPRPAGQARRPAAQHADAAFHAAREKRGRIAEETLEIYAPLAGRMGMHDMREELEELAFKPSSTPRPTRR